MKQLTIALLIVMPVVVLGQTGYRHTAQSLPLVSSLQALSVLGAEDMQMQAKQDTSVTEPNITKRKEPVYPEEALRQKLEGTVWVKVWVDSTGKSCHPTILKSTNELFNKAALEAVRQFEFSPALHGGKPVSIWVAFPIRFNLPGKPAQADTVRK
jgi:TonB family protein